MVGLYCVVWDIVRLHGTFYIHCRLCSVQEFYKIWVRKSLSKLPFFTIDFVFVCLVFFTFLRIKMSTYA